LLHKRTHPKRLDSIDAGKRREDVAALLNVIDRATIYRALTA